MNKILKYGVICSFSMATIGAMTACESTLDEVLYSELGDENAFVTASDALASVNGIYQPLTGIANRTMAYLNDMPGDVCGMKGLGTEIMNENGLDNHEDVILMWNRCYNIISRANIAIVKIKGIDDELFTPKNGTIEEAIVIKNRYIAEAKAMRAYAYYMLTDTYYKVPLVTDPETLIASKPPLAEVVDLENQIQTDLTEAINDLPLDYGSKADDGRVTKAAAQGFLMRLHMRRAGRDRMDGKDATADWTAALSLANTILGYSRYALVDDLWAELYNPIDDMALYNKEAIFTIRANPNGNQGASAIGLTYTPWSYDMGWDLINVTLQFSWKYDPADQRAGENVLVTDYPDVYNNAKNQKFYVVPKTMAEAGSLSVAEKEIEGVKYTTIENGACYTRKYKYARAGTYNYNCGNNFYVLRLADVILCKAECINELSGPTNDAIECVNQIRSRAFGDDAHGLKPNQTANKDEFRRALCLERGFEFNSEGNRRQDLIRMGLWQEVMSQHFNEIKQTVIVKEDNAVILHPDKPRPDYSSEWKIYPFDLKVKDTRMYFPIPKRESDLNPSYLENRKF